MLPFARALELLQTIPGVGRSNAEVCQRTNESAEPRTSESAVVTVL